MGFKSDIEIAQECVMEPITKIAEKAGIDEKYLEQYGKYKAKIDYNLLNESDAPNGKLILVTAINTERIRRSKWKTDSCYSHQPHTGRRRKDYHNGRSGRRYAEIRQESYGCPS